ncbi:MAG: AAA family ATPase [Gemmatimonadota bacterium]|nr:AAA family ATPase [Gemmatimonadota bacterium]
MADKDPQGSIVIVSEQFRFPYSKGLMARSLIRSGLPSEQSYRIATEIQDRLIEEKAGEVPRSQIKEMASRMIKARFGTEAALKYEHWKIGSGTIHVGDESRDEPFSRGLLAQSLLAAGLDPEIAHSVAERMAADLEEWGIRSISRNELRRMSYQKILSSFGSAYARHYLLWRSLKRPDKPLILIFAGATGTGKSSLSVEIAHRLGITRVIGTDTIREIMRGMFSRELMPSIYESSFVGWRKTKRPFGDKDDPVLAGFQEQVARVNVGVNAIMRRAINEHLSTVLEGVHLVPDKVPREICEKAIVIKVLICTCDEEMHRNRFIGRGEEAVERESKKYLRNFKNIRKIQDALMETARANDVFIADNIDFDESVGKIIQYLTQRMGDLVDLDVSDYE